MSQPLTNADVTIRLRANAQDKDLIDHAAQIVGATLSQFILASALNQAKNVLLDQSTVFADATAFQEVMDWMDAEAASTEIAGLKRILVAKTLVAKTPKVRRD